MALTNKLSAIGDAIREKTGKTDLITLDNMPAEILSITTSSGDTTTTDYLFINTATGSVTTITADDFQSDKTVVGIRPFAFAGCESLTSVTLPSTISVLPYNNDIGVVGRQFYGCIKLSEANIANTKLPYIDDYMFYKCTSLKNITLPESINNIYYYAFNYSGLESITIPSNVQGVYAGAFRYCEDLSTVTFNGTPSEGIDPTAFTGCSSLSHIYVPWSQGTVDSAPWGATSATIHYNS